MSFVFRSNNVSTNDMDSTGSITSIQTALDKLAAQRDELGELWATRKLRLDLCLQLRIFERDALEVVYYTPKFVSNGFINTIIRWQLFKFISFPFL